MKQKIKWVKPNNGCCEYFDSGGYRYFITQKYTDGDWHLTRRKKNPNYGVRTKCKSFRELYTKLTGSEPAPAFDGSEKKESDIEFDLRFMTRNVCGENQKSYQTADGRYIAVDFIKKEFWEYPGADDEIASPDFKYIPDLKEHAQKYYAPDDGQQSLFDLR